MNDRRLVLGVNLRHGERTLDILDSISVGVYRHSLVFIEHDRLRDDGSGHVDRKRTGTMLDEAIYNLDPLPFSLTVARYTLNGQSHPAILAQRREIA